ncbi:uncharacterized protein RSE6_04959 [Rhynchosporium secalis]|uniref:Uncharacterized protein n=1 Tax=Rhynchosporium secalis TaxID=38038 RepID=A0A1E1M6L8_RHYSE|nr:uncharacterized protein RSE6_04959 [Rhynchosporium secalis]
MAVTKNYPYGKDANTFIFTRKLSSSKDRTVEVNYQPKSHNSERRTSSISSISLYVQHYGIDQNTSLDLNSLSLDNPLPSPLRRTRNHEPGSPTKVLKPKSPRKVGKRAPRTPTSARKQKLSNTAASEANFSISTALATPTTPRARTRAQIRSATQVTFSEPPPQVKRLDHGVDFLDGNTFFPSVIIGAKETVGLSKIGRANQEVKMWENILAEHKANMPSLVSVVEEKLWQAKHKRACIDETVAENLMIGDFNPAESMMKARLKVLEWALSTSKFGPEAENIECAIAGYNSGDIGFNDHLTVIYAGHIFGGVSTYSEFVRTRTEILDKCFEMYGEGWMWYEPPLNVHPESKPKAFSSVGLEREENWTALGGFYVNQGYWKRAGWVSRMKQTAPLEPALVSVQFEEHPRDPDLVNCQAEGPRLSYRSILDSGATFPSLHEEDFYSLGINTNFYAAQSVTCLETANGEAATRLFELFVCVLDDEGKQLVDEKNAVYPLSHKYLGGMCPVVQCITPLKYSAQGIPIANRLSGIIPFAASYVSSAPTRNVIYLGEDRNDVLGAHRMPGQRKWSIDMPTIKNGIPFDRYGDPKIQFTHRRGLMIDVDDDNRNAVSYLRVRPQAGGGAEVVVVSDPGTAQRQMKQADDAAEAERTRLVAEAEARRLEAEFEASMRDGGRLEGLFDDMLERGLFPSRNMGNGSGSGSGSGGQ